MGESDEQRTQEESAEVEGHLAGPEGNRIGRQEEGSEGQGDFEGHMKNHHMKNRPAKKT
jgi:hypothetical protein